MNCLTDYVPLKTCDVTTSPSGHFINELPGIQLEMVEKIANEDQQDFQGVWDDVQKNASMRLKNDVIASFAGKYKLKQIYKSINLGKEIDTITTIAAATDYRGVMIELNDEDADYVDSNLQSIYVDKIRFYCGGAVAMVVKVFDLDTETQLYTHSLTAVAGWNDVDIIESFAARRIYVAVDYTNSASVYLDVSRINNYPFTNWNDGCICLSSDCHTVGRVTGVTSTIADKYTLTESNNAHGVSVVFSVKCAYDNIVCNNKELFVPAWKYLLGSELMSMRLYTSRLNEYTTIKKDQAMELKQLFEAQYRGGVVNEIKYPGELNQLIYSIELSKSDVCLECDAPIRFMQTTP